MDDWANTMGASRRSSQELEYRVSWLRAAAAAVTPSPATASVLPAPCWQNGGRPSGSRLSQASGRDWAG